MRISDWSSDVCSSDLHQHEEAGGVEEGEDEEEHGVHRIARAHHHDPRGHGDGGEEIEGQGLNDHAAGLLSVSRPLRPWPAAARSEEHTSELQSLMRISYAVFCLQKQNERTVRREDNVMN